MRVIQTLATIALLCAGSTSLSAATVGSFDASRTFTAPQVFSTGTKRSEVRGTIAAAGSTIAAATDTLTAGYLSGVNVFFNSALSNSTGILSAAEQGAMVAWVNGGGILVSSGEQSFFSAAYSSFLNPFGITLGASLGGAQKGAVFATDAGNAFLANGVGGSALTGINGVSLLSDGAALTIARINSSVIGVSKQVGAGYVVAIGDSNFLDNSPGYDATTGQFVRNILTQADAVAAVPLPAAGLLLLAALGGLGAASKRRRAV